MKGGKILSNKKKACIIKPSIKCKNKKTMKKKKSISKIIIDNKFKQKSKKEMNMNNIIKKIKGFRKWSITFDYLCKPIDYDSALKIDKDISKCFKKISNKKESYNYYSNMLVGEYGGIILKKYFDSKFNNKNIYEIFYALMKDIKNILFGLKKLYENNICHLDIKYDNIVYDKDKLKIIDFGISSNMNNITNFKTIINKEYNSKRLYIFYPLEFIFFNNKISLKKLENRNNFNILSNIYNILNINLDDVLNNNGNNLKNIIKKLDTYSFGLMMILLLYQNDLIKYIDKNDMIKDFFNLFKNMCEPLHENRLSIHEAYSIHLKLLNVYNTR